mmetsp:Transcript_12709/g.37823  ORF Transcript_12709/g.37823 Transcript_12709/m.37823 type:complete len:240 (-) Transcript_12709:29-748(-)
MADSLVFRFCCASAAGLAGGGFERRLRGGCDGIGGPGARRPFGFAAGALARSRCFRTAAKSTSPDGGWGHFIFFCTARRKASSKHFIWSLPGRFAKSVLRILSPYSPAPSSSPGFMFRGFMVDMTQWPRRVDGRRPSGRDEAQRLCEPVRQTSETASAARALASPHTSPLRALGGPADALGGPRRQAPKMREPKSMAVIIGPARRRPARPSPRGPRPIRTLLETLRRRSVGHWRLLGVV